MSYISPIQLNCVRCIGTFTADRLQPCLRGFAFATGTILYFVAYRYLPFVEASVIVSSAPILTTAMARIHLKEKYGLTQIICLVLTIIGVLLSIRIPELLRDRNNVRFDASYLGGLAAAVRSVFFISLVTVLLRKLKHVHYSIITMYSGFIGCVECAILCAIAFPYISPYCGWDNALCVAVGVLGVVTNSFNTLAVQKQPAGLVAVERASIDILVSTVFQIMFFSEYPDLYVISGAILVLISLATLGIKNYLLMMPQDSKVRKKLRWFLF